VRIRDVTRLFVETTGSFDKHNGSSYAAAIAYHAIISMGPLLLFSIAVASRAFSRDAAVDQLIFVVAEVAGPAMAQLLDGVIAELRQPTTDNLVVTVVSLGVGVYFASNVFRQLVIALDAIWEVKRPRVRVQDGLVRSALRQSRRYVVGLLAAIVIIFSLLIAMTLSVVAGPIVEMLHAISPLFATICLWIGRGLGPILFVLVCALTFKLLPSIELTWFDVGPGALLTGLVLAVAESIIAYYAIHNPIPAYFGLASSIVIIMLWAFFSAFILLFGAELTRIYVVKYGSLADRTAV
jgi:membrane protein